MAAVGALAMGDVTPHFMEYQGVAWTYECRGYAHTPEELIEPDTGRQLVDFEPCEGELVMGTFRDMEGNIVYADILGGRSKYDHFGKFGKPEDKLPAIEWVSVVDRIKAPTIAEAAIARGATTTADSPGAASSLTYAHTNNGANTLIFQSARIVNTTDTVTSVTYNGVAMNQISNFIIGVNVRDYVYEHRGGSSGSNNVVITASASQAAINGRTASYSGVHQASFPDNSLSHVPNTSTSLSFSMGATTTGAWAIAFMHNVIGAWTVTSGLDIIRGGNSQIIADSNGTCSTCTITGTHGNGLQGGYAVVIAPAVDAPVGATSSLYIKDASLFIKNASFYVKN